MITLSKEQSASIRISRFIFHVVHHGEPEPYFLNELDIGEFEQFFLDKVRNILKSGTAYEFNPHSEVCTILEDVNKEPSHFVDSSRKLASALHSHGLNDKRIKKGVMIFMELKTLEKDLFAIIKYEHEQVIRYCKNGENVILENVTETFTQSPDSMQKAAIIDMSDEIPDIVVLDRHVRAGISGFFQGFLNVHRKKSAKDMTKSLWNVVKETSNEHMENLPQDFVADVQNRADNFLKTSNRFDNEAFFTQIFGPHANEQLRNTYKHCLKKEDIENEQFYLDKEAVIIPKKRKIKTAEGVTIYINEKASPTVQISYGQNGDKDIIVIESSQIREEL